MNLSGHTRLFLRPKCHSHNKYLSGSYSIRYTFGGGRGHGAWLRETRNTPNNTHTVTLSPLPSLFLSLILSIIRYWLSLTNFLGSCGVELYPGQQHLEVEVQILVQEALHLNPIQTPRLNMVSGVDPLKSTLADVPLDWDNLSITILGSG